MQQNKQLKYGLNLSTKKSSQHSIFSDDDDNTTTCPSHANLFR
jgi:hypothetical protein